jgi:small subunit ribosomal protein S20
LANHKSAVKRARQNLRRRTRNNQRKSAIKTAERSVQHALTNKAANAVDLLKEFTSTIMKGVSKGVVNKKRASRKIGRIASKLSQNSR